MTPRPVLPVQNVTAEPLAGSVCVSADIPPEAEMGAGSVATSCPRLLCSLCGFPKENHRPESQAHHSECTLEQFTTVEKIPYVKMTRPDIGNEHGCWMPLASFHAEDEFAGAEPGEQILLEFGLMTRAEYEAMPEFEGW